MALAKRVDPKTLAFILPEEAHLPRDEALLALVAALAADGHRQQLERILRYALECGVPEPQVREALLQTYLFCGLWRAEAAFAALGRAQSEGPKDPLSALFQAPPDAASSKAKKPAEKAVAAAEAGARGGPERGRKALFEIHGKEAHKVEEGWRTASPDLVAWALEDYGRILARPGLAPRTRALLAVAAHVPQDLAHALKGYIRGARAIGVPDETLWAVHDLLVRVFEDSPTLRGSREAFEGILGRREQDEEPGASNPLMWD